MNHASFVLLYFVICVLCVFLICFLSCIFQHEPTWMALYLSHCKSLTARSHMHHLTCGINSLLHSVNLILFTVLLVYLILCISPHHSYHLRSHHLSFLRPFTPDLKLISFTNPFLHSHCSSFWTAFTDLNVYWIKWALAFVCLSFFFFLFLATYATLSR